MLANHKFGYIAFIKDQRKFKTIATVQNPPSFRYRDRYGVTPLVFFSKDMPIDPCKR